MRRWRSDDILYVISDKGDIVALRGTPVARARREAAQPSAAPRRAERRAAADAAAPGG